MTDADAPQFSSSAASFPSHGVACAASVYRPVARRGSDAGAPVIVMAHGFGAVRALRLPAYAERFAAAGYTVLTFDYRGFGDSAGTPRQVLDVSMQHEDWTAALGYARRLDGVDPERVVAWGTSFAGGHVLTLAGRGEPLAAVIAQVPHVSGPAAVRATGIAAAARLALPAVRDQLRALRGRPPVYVPAAGLPGTTAAMTSPDAVPGAERLKSDSGVRTGEVREDVAARIVLRIGAYSPRRTVDRITCPVLVQIAERDAITPSRVARRAAAGIRHSTVHAYDCGHFDPYVEPFFATVVADQLAFLAEHVPTTDAV
jgi:uncharacterized protein